MRRASPKSHPRTRAVRNTRSDVYGRPGKQESGGRSYTGTFLVDPSKERKNGAGTNGQNASGNRSDRIRNDPFSVRTKEFQNGVSFEHYRYRSGDEERGNKTQKNMFTRIFLKQVESVQNTLINNRMSERNEIESHKDQHHQQEDRHVFHSSLDRFGEEQDSTTLTPYSFFARSRIGIRNGCSSMNLSLIE